MAFPIKIGLQDGGNGMSVYPLYNIQETNTLQSSVLRIKMVLFGLYQIFLLERKNVHAQAILVPLITGECDTSESPSQSDADSRQCSTAGDEYGAISATLDGQKIENLDSYRTATDFFNITYVKDNIFDVAAGTYRGIADGFFVFLKPLSVGNHELQVKSSVNNPTTPSYNYASEANYHLKISPKSQIDNNINQTN